MTEKKRIRKIVVIGPECTGKSDLSQFLADHFKTSWVPEYARGFLSKLNRAYHQNDLLAIAHGQLRLEDEWMQDANKMLICDTNLYVIKVWSEFRFGSCDPAIIKFIETRPYDLYLLTDIDIPWQEDPQREHPDKRQQLFEIYQKEMSNQDIPFVEIRGEREQRRKTAVEAIEKLYLK